MPNPSNETLAEMIRGFRELVELKFKENVDAHDRTSVHLGKLNGQTKKNTLFREKWKTIMIVLVVAFGVLVPVIQSVVANFLSK